MPANARCLRRERGAGMVELMVAVLIELLAVAIIWQVVQNTEGYKRKTTGVSDVQQAATFALYSLGLEAANAGSGVSLASTELANCPDTKDAATTLRPVPALIVAGASNDVPDQLVLTYGTARVMAAPANLLEKSPADNQFVVQSPNGFAVGDRVVAVQQTAGVCTSALVTARSPALPPAATPAAGGRILVTTGTNAAVKFKLDSDVSVSVLIDLGPAGERQRLRYAVVDSSLVSTDLLDAAAVPVTLATNVVNVKFQYGIDTDATPDNIADTWVPATGNWAQDKVLAASLQDLMRIKALRIGIVMRSSEYDRAITGTTPYTLFDCAAHDDTCVGRITGKLPANWRYRVYETVVPLRNQLWNGP
ncbi:MAG: PilW family protein [Burkholderiales bacterium]